MEGELRKLLPCLLLALSLLFVSAGPIQTALAAESEADQKSLVLEVRQLTAAINRLATLYEEDRQHAEQVARSSKLDTAIAYLNFRSRRIERLEQDLQQLKTGRDRLATAFMRLEERHNLMDDQARTSMVGFGSEREKERAEQQVQLKILHERIDRSEQDIVALDNKIQELQAEISSVESYVQRNLEF